MFVTSMNHKIHSKPKHKLGSKVTYLATTLTTEVPVSDVLNRLISDHPKDMSGAEDFKWEYLCSQILTKFSGHDDDIFTDDERRDKAIEKMLVTEENCRDINANGYRPVPVNNWFEGVMLHAQRFISRTLGKYSESVFDNPRFTAGASTSLSRRNASIDKRYLVGSEKAKNMKLKPLDVSAKAFPYAYKAYRETPIWKEQTKSCNFNIISAYNRVTTVPKNAKIDRAIAMEPDLNMYLQLSVGAHIRSRLQRIGCNLNDQKVNQTLALQGSIDKTLATIDLSSASDSISYKLVMDLLPFDWFCALDALRADFGVLPDGRKIEWQKFSSMGNGFTFELESLLFLSIVYGCSKMANRNDEIGTEISVYGDDIICPTSIAMNVITALAAVGFETNVEKTFISGSFRESCGRHYYDGHDVSPFFIRRRITDYADICRLCNRLREWAACKTSGICNPVLYPLWYWLSRKAPNNLRGGANLERTDYICSPGLARKRLAYKTTSHRLVGFEGLLTVMQSMKPNIGNVNGIPFQYLLPQKDLMAEYSMKSFVNLTQVRFVNNDEPDYARCPYLFLEEL